MTDRADLPNVREADRLAAAAVVRYRQHTDWDMATAVFLDELFELCRIQISFERMAASGIHTVINDQINGRRAGVLDIASRGVEVIVARDEVSSAANQLKQNSFACP